MELVVRLDVVRDVPLIELIVRVDPSKDVKYPDIVDRVGTRSEERTIKEDVTCASWEIKKFVWMELVVKVEPVSEVK